MTRDEVIENMRNATKALNAALGEAAELGIQTEVRTTEISVICYSVRRPLVSVHLTKYELDITV